MARTAGRPLALRPPLLAALTALALVTTLVVAAGVPAEAGATESLTVEVNVLDDAGQPAAVEVCTTLLLRGRFVLPDGGTDEAFLGEDGSRLPPGVTNARYGFSFATTDPSSGSLTELRVSVVVTPCDEDDLRWDRPRLVQTLTTLVPTVTFDVVMTRNGIITAQPVADTSIPGNQCIQLYQYDNGRRTAASARSVGGEQLRLVVDRPGRSYRYGVDACTYEDEEPPEPFPFQPVFYDNAPDLQRATDVSVAPLQTRDLGQMRLSAPGSTPTPPPTETVGGFRDVPVTSVHAQSILWLVEQGITSGRADGTFGPAVAVTRGQMASFLDRALELTPASRSADFPDVPPGSTHAAAIDRLVDAGIASGRADGTYGPNAPVTRGQMATFLDRALDLPPASRSADFPDVPPGSTHAAAIDRLVDAGIASGRADGTYGPNAPVTRGQMATFLFAALNLDADPATVPSSGR